MWIRKHSRSRGIGPDKKSRLSLFRPCSAYGFVLAVLLAGEILHCAETAAPDISSIAADLYIPALEKGKPAPGKRVRQVHPTYQETDVYHVLYLPTDWEPVRRYPVIVELSGNGPYRNAFGDISTGDVEGGKLGYGLAEGKKYIWLCLPFINGTATANVKQWWGDEPDFDPVPTVDYCLKTVPWICEQFGGDRERIFLYGFSRGAIACNFIGLYNDQIAKLWAAFIAYSHYDGVRESWVPGADRKSALSRLRRLGTRRQFILHEVTSDPETDLAATRSYLEHAIGDLSRFQFIETGFRNHNDSWILRPSAARKALRIWLESQASQ
ncbi:MAG: hypothetical protein ACWGQW_06655 [bacterium]